MLELRPRAESHVRLAQSVVHIDIEVTLPRAFDLPVEGIGCRRSELSGGKLAPQLVGD